MGVLVSTEMVPVSMVAVFLIVVVVVLLVMLSSMVHGGGVDGGLDGPGDSHFRLWKLGFYYFKT